MPSKLQICTVNYRNVYTIITDDGLEPFSLYEYSVVVVNSAGSTQSDYTLIKTLQAQPEGLMAPNATLDPKQLYMIFLTWNAPTKPNGNIKC